MSQGRIKVTVVRPTGVMNTGLGATVVNPAALTGIVGANEQRYIERVMALIGGTLDGPAADIDEPAYWAIAPEVIAAEIIHAIDQPWGVTIGDVTIRATGEEFIL